MNKIIPIIEGNEKFTPFIFYNSFLRKVANYYYESHSAKENPVEFSLFNNFTDNSVNNKGYIDPITIPLFLSLSEQLKNYHLQPLKLHLSNDLYSNETLAFLDKADFFHIIGNNNNPNYPKGQNIFNFDPKYLGGYKNKDQRKEHKIRSFSLSEIPEEYIEKRTLIEKRDYLVSYCSIEAQKHFYELLFETNDNIEDTNLFIDILSELIANGLVHSSSNVYSMMFSNRYQTKFSISDNGIGLYNSLNDKKGENIYEKFKVFNKLKSTIRFVENDEFRKSLLSIFEALYYSIIKNRLGLFDLIFKVVLEKEGYFRIHNENSQLIISKRLNKNLIKLFTLRKQILELYDNKILLNTKNDKEIIKHKEKMYLEFVKFSQNIIEYYNTDTKFSSIRIYPIKFKGVHIEVEIPKQNEL